MALSPGSAGSSRCARSSSTCGCGARIDLGAVSRAEGTCSQRGGGGGEGSRRHRPGGTSSLGRAGGGRSPGAPCSSCASPPRGLTRSRRLASSRTLHAPRAPLGLAPGGEAHGGRSHVPRRRGMGGGVRVILGASGRPAPFRGPGSACRPRGRACRAGASVTLSGSAPAGTQASRLRLCPHERGSRLPAPTFLYARRRKHLR